MYKHHEMWSFQILRQFHVEVQQNVDRLAIWATNQQGGMATKHEETPNVWSETIQVSGELLSHGQT